MNKSLIFLEDLQIKAAVRVMGEARVVADAGAVEKVGGDRYFDVFSEFFCGSQECSIGPATAGIMGALWQG